MHEDAGLTILQVLMLLVLTGFCFFIMGQISGMFSAVDRLRHHVIAAVLRHAEITEPVRCWRGWTRTSPSEEARRSKPKKINRKP